MISLKDVQSIQKKWGENLVELGKLKGDFDACKKESKLMIDSLYGFDNGEVLFKPTKAKDQQFRLTFEGAQSYFIGEDQSFSEDKGFALQPWTNVRFENASVILNEKSAIAMGNYFFTEANGNEVKVEYTFGYFLNNEGELKINLHHSSLPYSA
ncbi:MAG: hypothetical protein ACPGKX_02230 [Flavobacteriaceae bacterium]